MSTIIDVEGHPEVDVATVSPGAATIITFLRRIELDTHRIWLDTALDVEGRLDRLDGLLREARASVVPELTCRVVERASLAHMGEPPNRWERAVIEEGIARDVERGRIT